MILDEEKYREKLIRASRKISSAVSTTYGQKGGNVLIAGASRDITKDGYTVASNVFDEDPATNHIIKVIFESASKTVADAGDGTTTSIVLTDAIIQRAITKLDKYTSVYDLANDIKSAVSLIIDEVKNLAEEVTDEDIYRIALTSANNDSEIAKTIQKAFELAGKDGFVDIKPSPDSETLVKSTQGMTLKSGFLDEEFLEINASAINLEKPKVLVYKKEITSIEDIQEDLEGSTNCLVFAHSYSKKAIDEFITYRKRTRSSVIPIKNPYVTSVKGEIAEDLRVYCNGSADEVIISKYTTTINKKDAKVDARVSVLTEQKEQTEDLHTKEQIQDRISNLSGTSCCIYIGASSDVEYGEKLDRYDDALGAVKSSLVHGYIAGGGSTLHYIAQKHKKALTDTLGGEIIYEALSIPARTLLSKANIEFNKYKDQMGKKYNKGIDLRSGKLTDMIDSCVIDPAMVTIKALESSSSVSSILLSTKKMIVHG